MILARRRFLRERRRCELQVVHPRSHDHVDWWVDADAVAGVYFSQAVFKLHLTASPWTKISRWAAAARLSLFLTNWTMSSVGPDGFRSRVPPEGRDP